MRPISLLHISDLHFKEGHTETAFDTHRDIRVALEADVRQFLDAGGHLDAVLVTGDIAYAGRAAEYALAKAWFDVLCDIAGCGRDKLRCVPGNHDIDRGVQRSNAMLKDTIAQLRSKTTENEAAEKFARYIQHSSASFFSPLEAYNDFASAYSSKTLGPNETTWKMSLELNDFSTLDIYGLNSALLCNEDDDLKSRELLLGAFQLNWVPRDSITCLTMCHHVPELFRDFFAVTDIWKQKAKIQLFGHRHDPREYDNREHLQIVGGALHPDAKEGALPYFNYITLWVEAKDELRTLQVKTERRTWNPQHRRFDRGLEQEFPLPLPPWRAENVERMIGIAQASGTTITPQATKSKSGGPRMADDSRMAEELVDDFLHLEDGVRSDLIAKYSVSAAGDETLDPADLFLEVFIRLNRSERLQEFLKEASAARRHG